MARLTRRPHSLPGMLHAFLAGVRGTIEPAPDPILHRSDQMRKGIQIFAVLVLSAGASTACGGHDKSATTTSNGDAAVNAAPAGTATATAPAARVDTVPAAHHSKLGGAVVGAAVGHVLGGHAVAGAAAGALIQHERNKH